MGGELGHNRILGNRELQQWGLEQGPRETTRPPGVVAAERRVAQETDRRSRAVACRTSRAVASQPEQSRQREESRRRRPEQSRSREPRGAAATSRGDIVAINER
ncbi:Uncharacterized protein Fot_46745 [Forsythia ovata]|uniref:Uncharacterized protein n=1 Tax=Forsythia ovata TaxID=205694 RepID=A0ABD1QRN5_9LAMI